MNIQGLHHVTAIASDPQRNLDFYVGVLGLRLVKRTINFDDPGSYHFYFGDAVGAPGTILTFFPWPHARRGSRGNGETESTAFTIPPNSITYWSRRLTSFGLALDQSETRFEQRVLRFQDPDGMLVELIASDLPVNTTFWNDGPVPAEHAIRGFHSVTLALDAIEPTTALLKDTFGYRRVDESSNRVRFASDNSIAPGVFVDLFECPGRDRGRMGAGSVHHVAFRAADGTHQLDLRNQLGAAQFGVSPVMDRVYFQSIYFREPGGVLFEIATDGPGFEADEPLSSLGEALKLPPWLESARDRIETILPTIEPPTFIRS